MKKIIRKKITEENLIAKITELSGQNLLVCYQCGKCSAGCPAVAEMDLLPNQVIRYAQLGFIDELLESNSMWLCASCLTCNSRCPKGINIVEVMEALRQLLLRQREDHVTVNDLSDRERENIPPIALISNLRKFSS